MNIYPAIDIIDKKVVRLLKGDYNEKKEYSLSPLEAVKGFEDKGASFLHLVDLDGAKSGETDNFSVIKEITENTSLFVEVGGGIRSMERIEKYLSVGVGRVILGTAALEDPDFLCEAISLYGERIAVGVDAKNGFVATRGWLDVSSVESFSFCEKMHDIGVKNIIYTDISCDGALRGTNLEAFRRLKEIEGLEVTASGGVTFESEIIALRDMGVENCILGKALYEGKLDLKRAISIAEGD